MPPWVLIVEGRAPEGGQGREAQCPNWRSAPGKIISPLLVSISLCAYNKKARVSPNTRDGSSSRSEIQIWSTRRSFIIIFCCPRACGILVPRPGMEPTPPALAACTAMEVPKAAILKKPTGTLL